MSERPDRDGPVGEADLRPRVGDRPRTTTSNPQTQLDQQPAEPLSRAMIASVAALPGVSFGPSARAPIGTIGAYLDPGHARGPARAFLLGREFMHIHPDPDHSLHMTLPDGVRARAIAAGWAIAHPMAGAPTISPDLVMVYAPRDAAEMETVISLITAAWRFASGQSPEQEPLS